MFEPSRHIPLEAPAWDSSHAREAIADIVADAQEHYSPTTFWPAHPQDEGIGDGHTSLYMGAAGVIWALHYLARSGAADVAFDFRASVPELLARNAVEFSSLPYAAHGSLLFGDLGAHLVAFRIARDETSAEAVHTRASSNNVLPIRELMWGLPGSMLACLHMAEMTGEDRWAALFKVQARRLIDELNDTDKGPLWYQDLYGTIEPWLGPVHGYAGNMIPLIRGWTRLEEQQRARIAAAIPETLQANAWPSEHGVNWHGRALRSSPPKLCQHCHGAPGMVTAFADAPFAAPELDNLLLRAGELVWRAGPLAKGPNLCHGTGGNGYAFLKLFRRTGDALWLDRARAFAMAAVDQYRDARTRYGRGRYSLWTGDVGLAIYLWDCITAEPRFPSIDVL